MIAAADIAALGIGAHAASTLSEGARGRVLAVFARGVHVLLDDGLVVTVGDASLGSGPLSLLVASPDRDALAATPGDPVTMARRGVLRVGSARVDWRRAPRYRTPPPPPVPDTATLRACRARFDALDGVPAEGFAWRLHRSPPSAPLATAAVQDARRRALRDATRTATTALDGWLAGVLDEQRMRNSAPRGRWANAPGSPETRSSIGTRASSGVPHPSPAIRALLGAGPGLTPAGDDLLAGVMLALHRLHRADAATALWRTLAPALGERTHPFAASQLALAASGEHAACVGALLDAVLGTASADPGHGAAPPLRERLDAIGATSGWDIAAGVATVVDARLAVERSAADVSSRSRSSRAPRC